jgi:hypothetical protein
MTAVSGERGASHREYGLVSRVVRSVVDHVARATCEGAVGWGLFEHASLGRHDPSGFADWTSVAL